MSILPEFSLPPRHRRHRPTRRFGTRRRGAELILTARIKATSDQTAPRSRRSHPHGGGGNAGPTCISSNFSDLAAVVTKGTAIAARASAYHVLVNKCGPARLRHASPRTFMRRIIAVNNFSLPGWCRYLAEILVQSSSAHVPVGSQRRAPDASRYRKEFSTPPPSPRAGSARI